MIVKKITLKYQKLSNNNKSSNKRSQKNKRTLSKRVIGIKRVN